ncbi:hypothetical protein M758_9G145700 [Ceratodon purpureus]|nr:hypothetical protein M758_9G145700 [Ceratodon purpureus]
MARFRKCPRSCAQGKSCKWINKMLQQVPPLKCPYFLKNVSSFMLWQPRNPCPRLEVPSDFVQAHNDKFNEMVEVKGPCKSTWFMRVNILICKHRRVMFDRGWRSFVNELALNKGDHLLFVLTAFSKFKVYVFDELGIRKKTSDFPETIGTCYIQGTTGEQRPLKQSFIWPNEREYPRQDANTFHELPNQAEHNLWEEDTAEVSSELWKRKLRDRGSLAGPVVVELSDDLECEEANESEDIWKESEVQSEEASSFQFSQRTEPKKPSKPPHFIKRVPAISLKYESGMSCTHLEVPATFSQRYDGLFKDQITLQGPTGRIWKVICQTTIQQQYKRVKLRDGWMNFAEDNMLRLHDQLLFTHIAEGQFLVQIVQKGHCRRGRPRLHRPDYNPAFSGRKEHEDGARKNSVDQMVTPEEPTPPFQQPDINKDPLKNRIYMLQQQILAQRRAVHKQVENRCTGRRGRMEWGLGHS